MHGPGLRERVLLQVHARSTAVDHDEVLPLTVGREHAVPGVAGVADPLSGRGDESLGPAGPAVLVRGDHDQEWRRGQRQERLRTERMPFHQAEAQRHWVGLRLHEADHNAGALADNLDLGEIMEAARHAGIHQPRRDSVGINDRAERRERR